MLYFKHNFYSSNASSLSFLLENYERKNKNDLYLWDGNKVRDILFET